MAAPCRDRALGRERALATIALMMLLAPSADAQSGLRPGDERAPLPVPAAEPPSPLRDDGRRVRPRDATVDDLVRPESARANDSATALAEALSIRASGFEIRGATAFSRDRLHALFTPYVDRPLTTLELLAAVDSLRTLYQEAGYTTTTVHLPDQNLADGVVRVDVIEGRLDGISIRGAHHHRDAYFRYRLAGLTATPLDVRRLRRRLESLQREPGILRLAAVLEESGPGRHHLVIGVEEKTPWSLRARASNARSPSIGSLGGRLEGGHTSLAGFGDTLSLAGQWSTGLRDFRAAWEVPITPWATRLGIAYRRGRGEIVEEDFERFDIEGRFESLSLSIRQPVIRRDGFDVWLGVSGDWRRAASSIFERVECFQADLADCTPSAAILRLRGDASWRTARRAIAARSTLSIGLDVLAATAERDAGDRDGEFVAWLAQLQFAERLPEIEPIPRLDGTQLLVRFDLQLANDPLLAVEQIAVGGARTVRGYRQNQIVRDNGAIGSIELRVPVWRTGFDRTIVEWAPFVDIGHAWDRRRGRSPDRTLVAAGMALRVALPGDLRAELSWAHRFRDDLTRGDRLQRRGIYFEVLWNVF